MINEIRKNCTDEGKYPDVFNDDCGVGIKFEHNGKKLITIPRWTPPVSRILRKRQAILKISSFRGISSDAIHYYGKIEIEGIIESYIGEGQHSTMTYGKYDPLIDYNYNIELKRIIYQKEIDEDSNRYEYLDDGDYTQRFNSISNLIDLYKKITQVRFLGDWEFFIEYPHSFKLEKLLK